MFEYMDIKKYRVRFSSPHKTVVVYDSDLQSAKYQAKRKVRINSRDEVIIAEIYRV